jgi:ribose transport system substrate-binding protein
MLRSVETKIVLAAALLTLAAASAYAQDKKYVFAVVPKFTNHPFFDQVLAGCRQAEKELNGKVECFYTGPSENSGGEEQAQMVGGLATKKVDGIAVSVANAPAMAVALKRAKDANIPVLTWDSDLLPDDKGLRVAYIGTHNYEIGTNIGKMIAQTKPEGGTICIQSGGSAAVNLNERMQGIRDALSGTKSKEAPGDRLTGQNAWTEVGGCPLYTNDDPATGNQQLEDIFKKYPDLDAFAGTGGFGQFLPDAYTRTADSLKDKVASGELALVFADTMPIQVDLMKQGLSGGQVGQRPFEMGYKVIYGLLDIVERRSPPADPSYTGLDVCTPQTADTCIMGAQ